MHLPAGLVWPPLQRVLPCWLLWHWLPAALHLSERRRLPQHHWKLHLCPRLHGKMGRVSHGLMLPTLHRRGGASSFHLWVKSEHVALCPGMKNGSGSMPRSEIELLTREPPGCSQRVSYTGVCNCRCTRRKRSCHCLLTLKHHLSLPSFSLSKSYAHGLFIS